MTNLVHSWISLYPDLQSARDAINTELGLHTTSSRVRQWRDGKHPIPRTVETVMRRDVYLRHRLSENLLELITLPERK